MRTKGFTLIELLVTIGVLAALSAIISSMIGQSSRRYARDARRKSDLEQIRSALELYRNSNSSYPAALPTLVPGGYISSVPADPSSPARTYYYSASGVVYDLCAAMEKSGYSDSCGGAGGCTVACNYRTQNP